MERALRIMQNNITNDLDLEDIAARLGLSKSYFIRLFRQKMKTTPMKYFMKLKIEAAGAMLTSTDRPLLIIAQDLNFYSEFHFSRVFKKYTGAAPSVYRRQYLQLAGVGKDGPGDSEGDGGSSKSAPFLQSRHQNKTIP